MKKLLFAFAVLICSVGESHAVLGTSTVLKSTHTWVGVTLSASPAVNVLGTSGTAFTQVAIQNNDGALNIYCSENVNVATSGPLKGVKIPVGALFSFTLTPRQAFFCIHDGGGTIEPSVFRGR